MKNRSPTHILIRIADAMVIHRMLEFWMDDCRFNNPIVAVEVELAAKEAQDRLGKAIMVARGERR